MSGIGIMLAFLASLGVLGVGAEVLIHSARNLVASGSSEEAEEEPAKSWDLGTVGEMIWLALGLIIIQQGVWLAYLFLR